MALAGGPSLEQAASNPNLAIVGVGGDYPTIQAAIDSISGASVTNPYLVYVLPGVYDLASENRADHLKPYVNIDGDLS